MSSEPTIVDLFCGCGGFGLGAELAGFKTVTAIDIDSDLQSAYRLNFPKTNVIQSDISLLDISFWKQTLKGKRPTGVIGGPPCQGFSRIGKRDKNDLRNQLIFHFYRQINILKPSFFIMENVEGILDEYGMRIIQNSIDDLIPNYHVIGPTLINAADFGAPTNRKRAIIFGYDPQYFQNINLNTLLNYDGINKSTVADAIADLNQSLNVSYDKEKFSWASLQDTNLETSTYAKQARAKAPSKLGWDFAKEQLSKGKVSGFCPTVHSPHVRKRFENTSPGKIDKISKFPRLSWDKLAPTLRAGTGKDHGNFQAVRPIHPDLPRVINVREAARIQGFPDWFVFHPTKWHSFRMIGNSVSPYMAKTLLQNIKPHCS